MKILHITDSHGTVKSPESRTDIYYLAFLKKMYELKYVIKQEDIKLIIHTGDLFHSPRVSDKFAGQLSEIIKSYGIPMYVVPGNHDMDGYNISTLDQTKLGLLYKTGVVKKLDREVFPIQLKSQKENLNISISGQEYYKDIDTGNMEDFEMKSNNPNANFNILAIHGYLCDKPQHPSINHTLCQNITTDADVILSGHFHESFEYHGADFSVYNPGSLMRVEQNTYNKNHMPQYGILEIVNNNGIVQHNYTMHQFQIAEPSDKVFDYNTKAQNKKTLITLENFKNSIANTNLNNTINTSIEKVISDIASNLNIQNDITEKALNIYNNALISSPDRIEIQQGFISDPAPKYIENVVIKNFQSHESTTIKFKEGLNAIIGESNSGKTSILRAIRWCLDNDPHGSDFITTGQEECSVMVHFSDGTDVIRTRTRTNAGTYDVRGKTIQPDGTVTYWTDQYKGFSNNVPIEVVNIHQMPKVNLTKDICTHLNMMSQLDGPFLVTDSPQVKAAIIGRLTGTQIIDLAIKDTNKIILSNSKDMKTYQQEKEQKENELYRYQDIYCQERYLSLYNKLLDKCQDKLDVLEYINSTYESALEFKEYIIKKQDIINQHSINIDMFINMRYIYMHILDIIKLANLYNELKDTEQRINMLNNKINWAKILVSFIPFLDVVRNKFNIYVQIRNGYQKLNDLNNKISINEKSVNDLSTNIRYMSNVISDMRCIYNNVHSKAEQIAKVQLVFEQVQNVLEKYTSYAQTANQKDEDERNLNIRIDMLVKDQEELIRNNNICPCCGQKITSDEHIHNINNFMKGR